MNCLSILLAVSLHTGIVGYYNEIHPHVKCQVENISFGTYYNSEKSISTYMSFDLELPKMNIEVGLATGYELAPVLPLVRFKKGKFFLTPIYNPKGDNGFIIGFEQKIK